MQPKIAAATAASAAEAPYEEEQPSGEDKAALDETYIKAAYDEDEEGDEYSDLNAFLNDDDIEGVYSDSGASLSDGEDGGESEAGGEQPGNDLSDRAGTGVLTLEKTRTQRVTRLNVCVVQAAIQVKFYKI